jgi:acyl-CoA synthetase (AMP-forming)/AMP-acid ligase II
MPLFHIRALIAGVLAPMDAAGSLLASGQENNPSANAEAFVDGRFRTGDQAVMDADGYLTLTGRLK